MPHFVLNNLSPHYHLIYPDIIFQEIKETFDAFDRDHSGTLDFDEFLIALRVSSLQNQYANFL